MNYTNNQHQLTSSAYEGFGVYEFNVPGHWDTPKRGMSQFPGIPTGMPSAAEAITTQSGIQVVKGEYRDTAIGLLDQTTFNFDQADINAPTITGQASVILGTIGSGWASEYLAKGYAILAEISTIEGGTPTVMMTKNASDIASNASVGGQYVVIAAPGALLGSAMVLAGGTLPGPGQPPIDPSQFPAPPPGAVGPTKAGVTGTPSWVLPAALVGVGAIALIFGLAAGVTAAGAVTSEG